MPSVKLSTTIRAASATLSTLRRTKFENCDITFCAALEKSGLPLAVNMPSTKLSMIFCPASSKEPVFFTTASPMFLSKPTAAVIKSGKTSEIKSFAASNNDGASSFMASPIPDKACLTAGTILFTAVPTDVAKFFASNFMFAFLFDKPVKRFCHAALTEFKLPCIVVAASFAVVPVMPISVCTT